MENNLQIFPIPTLIASLNLRGFDLSNTLQYVEAENVISWNDGIAVRYGFGSVYGQSTEAQYPNIGVGSLATTPIYGINGYAKNLPSVPMFYRTFNYVGKVVGFVDVIEDNEKRLYVIFLDRSGYIYIQPVFEYNNSTPSGTRNSGDIHNPVMPVDDSLLPETHHKLLVREPLTLRKIANDDYFRPPFSYTVVKWSVGHSDTVCFMTGNANNAGDAPPNMYFSNFGEIYAIPDVVDVTIIQYNNGLRYTRKNVPLSSIYLKHQRIFGAATIAETGGLLFNQLSTGWTRTGTNNSSNFWLVYFNYQGSANITCLALATGSKAVMALWNDKLRSSLTSGNDGLYFTSSPSSLMWYDPTELSVKPWQGGLQNQTWGNTAVAKPCCWRTNENNYHFSISSNSGFIGTTGGILEANKVYEFTYSLYNALTGKESNVGEPALARNSTAGWYIIVKPSGKEHGFNVQTQNLLPHLGDLGLLNYPINYLYFCFYYRELGSFEWLPAGEISFVDAYFRTGGQEIRIGFASQIGKIGGQPGGFNDYSLLPKGDWFQTEVFDDRLFWVSKQEIRFSGEHNLDYPIRHFVTLPSGEIRGVIPHFFQGSANACGRLVIFGSEGVYDLRKSGQLLTQMIRLSRDTAPQPVEMEGSDYVVSFRSKETAFSFRTAVVAEGVLYYWGPDGIFRDDSVNYPQKVSQNIEPEVFNCYDNEKILFFFAHYDKATQNIFFFYIPKDNQDVTHAWVYSVRAEQAGKVMWSKAVYGCSIKWVKTFNFDSIASTNKAGNRTIACIHDGAFVAYHDHKVENGDGFNHISSVYRVSGQRLRFTVDASYTLIMLISGKFVRVAGGFYKDGKDLLLLDVNVVDKTVDVQDEEYPLSVGSTQIFMPNQYLSISSQIDAVRFKIKTAFLTPSNLSMWLSFRYAQLLYKGTSWSETDKPFVTFKWRTINNNQDSSTNIEFLKKQGEPLTQSMVELDQKGQAIQLSYEGEQWTSRYFMYSLNIWYALGQQREIFMWRQ